MLDITQQWYGPIQTKLAVVLRNLEKENGLLSCTLAIMGPQAIILEDKCMQRAGLVPNAHRGHRARCNIQVYVVSILMIFFTLLDKFSLYIYMHCTLLNMYVVFLKFKIMSS